MNEQRFDPEDQHLEPAWQALEQRMRSAELMKPRAGFSRRWLARYNARPVEEPRMRALLLAAANGLAALLLFALLLPALQPWIAQPGSVLAGAAEWVTKVWAAVAVVVKAFNSVAEVIPTSAWLAISTSALALLLVMALLFDRMDWLSGEAGIKGDRK